MKTRIIPTLIAKNQKDLDKLLKRYREYFRYFQVDVMDGKFVRNKSNWFKFKLDNNYRYEAHLMVNEPEKWIRKNYRKFDVLIANFEKVKNPIRLINFAKSKNKKIGFALNPETKIEKIKPYLRYLDRVLILTVHPGKYGAPFLRSSLRKIVRLRKTFKKDIEVDGHINPETIKLCKKAGANLFAVGSYLKDSKNVGKSIRELRKSLR